MEKICPFCQLTISSENVWCSFCGKHVGNLTDLTTTDLPQAPPQWLDTTTLSAVPGPSSPLPINPQEFVARGVQVGNFKLVKLLGEGGGGTVYLGEHTKIQRQVAIKILQPGLESQPDIALRFVQEASILSRLRHPSIVEVYDCGLSDEVGLFLIMEYLEGCDLDEYRKKRGLLSPREAALIGWQILNGLEAAHSAKIVHRDLKPKNVYMAQIGSSTVVKLLDFGIAKILDTEKSPTATQTGFILGTPAYMSPEQATSTKEADHRADLYSFGVMLFELVTGRRPFTANTAPLMMLMHKIELPPIPSAFVPDLPKAMERLILDCLEKHRDDRPQSATILKEMLGRILASLQESQAPIIEVPPIEAPPAKATEATQEIPTKDVPSAQEERVSSAPSKETPQASTQVVNRSAKIAPLAALLVFVFFVLWFVVWFLS